MSESGPTEHWTLLMGNIDALLNDIRNNASELQDQQPIQELLRRAEQQRAATEEAFRAFDQQRMALTETLDHLQSELAVAGRPLRGEVS